MDLSWFACSLRKLLDDNGMSQSDLARRTGISSMSVNGYVNGRTDPRLSSLLRIADCFGVTLDGLMRYAYDDVPEEPHVAPAPASPSLSEAVDVIVEGADGLTEGQRDVLAAVAFGCDPAAPGEAASGADG